MASPAEDDVLVDLQVNPSAADGATGGGDGESVRSSRTVDETV